MRKAARKEAETLGLLVPARSPRVFAPKTLPPRGQVPDLPQGPFDCTRWEQTAEMSPFVEGITSPIMRNLVTGERLASNKLPIGALYAARSVGSGGYAPGYDKLAIMCVCPDRWHWPIDGRASNCTMKDDDNHRCWVRHGTVSERVHVDKKGFTCAAGAGSLQIPGWHGYLHEHQLRTRS